MAASRSSRSRRRKPLRPFVPPGPNDHHVTRAGNVVSSQKPRPRAKPKPPVVLTDLLPNIIGAAIAQVLEPIVARQLEIEQRIDRARPDYTESVREVDCDHAVEVAATTRSPGRGPSIGVVLGATNDKAPVGSIEALKTRLENACGHSMEILSNVGRHADRLVGANPPGTGSDEMETKQNGASAELHFLVDILEHRLIAIHQQVDRFNGL